MANYNIIRQRILERDGKICQDCKDPDCPRALVVHHIDKDRSHNTDDNLITLCSPCHSKRHYDEFAKCRKPVADFSI